MTGNFGNEQVDWNIGLKDSSTPDFSTPSFNPRPFNPRFFNHELSNPGFFNPRFGVEKSGVEKSGVEKFMVEKSGVEKSGVGKFMVEKSGVERSGVEAWGWKVRGWNVLQPYSAFWSVESTDFQNCNCWKCFPSSFWDWFWNIIENNACVDNSKV